MKLKSFILFTLLTAMFAADAQQTINDVVLPATLKTGNADLTLNGGGIRKKLFFKVYVGALYVQAKTKNAAEVLNADKETGFRLVITSGVINSNNFSEAIEEGFGKSMNGNTAPLRNQINQLIATFKSEPINEGDVFDLIYVPGKGTQAYKAGKLKVTIPGLDFKKALFGIWLGTNPVDTDLKTALLGG